MPRVKCPHCGAGNQDATEQDTCWQCANVLGAPVARTEPASRPQMNISNEPTRQLDVEMLNKMSPPIPAPAKKSGLSPLVLVLVVLLIMAIVIMALAWKH